MPVKPEDLKSGAVFTATRPDGSTAQMTFEADMDKKTRRRLIAALLPYLTDDTTTETTIIEGKQ